MAINKLIFNIINSDYIKTITITLITEITDFFYSSTDNLKTVTSK